MDPPGKEMPLGAGVYERLSAPEEAALPRLRGANIRTLFIRPQTFGQEFLKYFLGRWKPIVYRLKKTPSVSAAFLKRRC